MYIHGQLVHFVGIGGVGMAGIAEVLVNLGYKVSGSDLKDSPLISHLRELGAEITLSHEAKNISEQISVVVISSAVKDDNFEVIRAKELGIPVIPRAEMLAELMRMKYGIAVAGSHGKTSTTSITAKLLQDLGLDPTVIIGGRVLSHQTGAKLGLGQYLVAEADESDGSFCLLRPAIAVVTNIDAEHMSYYSSFGALEEAFFQFMSTIPFYGIVAYCGDDPVLEKLAKRITRRKISFGLSPESDVSASELTFDGFTSSFNLSVRGAHYGRFTLPIPGAHMVSNALGAIAVALELGDSLSPSSGESIVETIRESLSTFPGVARRSEKIGTVELKGGDTIFIDDYGHHPAEISATLRALRRALPSTDSKLHVVFQPHRYSRTKELFADFLSCFEDASTVTLSEIYSAGEEPIDGISGESLSKSIQHKHVQFVKELNDAIPLISELIKPGDMVVTMGAGSVGKFSRHLLSEVSKQFA